MRSVEEVVFVLVLEERLVGQMAAAADWAAWTVGQMVVAAV